MTDSTYAPIIDRLELDELDALLVLVSPQAGNLIGDSGSVSGAERAEAAFEVVARLVAERVASDSRLAVSDVLAVINRELRTT